MTNERRLNGLRILAVDDSVEMTSLLAEVLAGEGAEVAEANCGDAAMHLLGHGDFDAVLLDVRMPAPDGWIVIEFLRNCRPDLLGRTIALTACRYDRAVVGRLREFGITCMYKPFLCSDLVSQVVRSANCVGKAGAAA